MLTGAHKVVHANIALYAFCFWFTQPILPYISKDLGADPVVFGWLQTTFAGVQLIGGPLIGRVVDVKGPKFALLLSQASAGLGYLLLALSWNLPLLFVSRLPTLGMHALHAAQAYVTLLSEDKARAQAIGSLSLSYGVGFVFGPILGGHAAEKLGYHSTALIAGCLSFAAVAITSTILPAVRASAKRSPVVVVNAPAVDGKALSASSPASADSSSKSFSFGEAFRVLGQSDVYSFISVKMGAAMGLALFQSNFSLTAQQVYGVDAKTNGYIMSFIGMLTMLVNTFFVGWITKQFSDQHVIKGGLLLMSLALLLISTAADLTQLLVFTVPLSLSGTTVATVITSALTKVVSPGDAGTVIGLDMAAGSFCRVLSPTMAGFIFAKYGFSYIGMTGATLAFGALVLSTFMLKPSPIYSKGTHSTPDTASASTGAVSKS